MEELKIKSLRNLQTRKISGGKAFFAKHQNQNSDSAVHNSRPQNRSERTSSHPSLPRRILGKIPLLAFVFLVGGLGGIYLDRFLLPYLSTHYPALNRFAIFKQVSERTIVIRETEEIKITQEDAAPRALEKTMSSSVSIEIPDSTGAMIKTGSGVILTSDGYILTSKRSLSSSEPAAVSTPNAPSAPLSFNVKLQNGAFMPGSLVTEDSQHGVAIIKVDATDLATIPYADRSALKLGQTILVMDGGVLSDIIAQFVSGYIPSDSPAASPQERIRLSHKLDPAYSGAAVINLKGELVGVFQSEDLVIPLGEISAFISTALKK